MLGYLTRLMTLSNQCHCCSQSDRAVVCPVCITQVGLFNTSGTGSFLNNQLFFKKHLNPLEPYRTLSVGPHAGLLQHLINDFKYGKKVMLKNTLVNLLRDKVEHCYTSQKMPQLLIPVPISLLKRMQRGFNQTELLSTKLGMQLNIETRNDLISRRILHAPQASLSGRQRRKLSPESFQIRQASQFLKHRHIALLDDVITTGSTLSCIAKQIKKANPDIKIDLWSLSVSLQHP